jgi:hypothetical protein
MTLGEGIRKIQALPEPQRKFIFIFLMTCFSLIALVFAVSSSGKKLSQARSMINIPSSGLPSRQTSSAGDTDAMTGESPTQNVSNMSAESSGFDPNEAFNFNDK